MGCWQRLPNVSDGVMVWKRQKRGWNVPGCQLSSLQSLEMCEWTVLRNGFTLEGPKWVRWWGLGGWASLAPPVGSRFNGEQQGCSSLLCSPWQQSPWEWEHRLVHPKAHPCPEHRTPLVSGQAPGCPQVSDFHPVVVSAQILLQQSPCSCSVCPRLNLQPLQLYLVPNPARATNPASHSLGML